MMMDYADNVRRAAETFLNDRYLGTVAPASLSLVVRGYTAEAIEDLLLPVADPEPPCRPGLVYPAAA